MIVTWSWYSDTLYAKVMLREHMDALWRQRIRMSPQQVHALERLGALVLERPRRIPPITVTGPPIRAPWSGPLSLMEAEQ